MFTNDSPRCHYPFHLYPLSFCLTTPRKQENLNESPFAFITQDCGIGNRFCKHYKCLSVIAILLLYLENRNRTRSLRLNRLARVSKRFVSTNFPSDLPLTNRVRGPYCKIRTELFPLGFMTQVRSAREKQGSITYIIFFLKGTVTNPAIWLVLYSVSIFLSLPTGHGNAFVSRRIHLNFRCHFS